MSQDHPSDHITERAADRNGRKKKRHYAAASFDRKQVGENRGRGRTVSSFAYSDEDARKKQDSESRRQARTGGRETPKTYGRADDYPAREPICQPTQCRRDEHVGDKESASENAADRERVFVAWQKERRTDGGFNPGQDLPVDIIKNVNRQEEHDRGPRAGS